jgi:hypothetical protein
MDEEKRPRGYGDCPNLVLDGAGDYCKILKIPESDYPHKYRRVFCYGNQNGMTCAEAKKKFGSKDGLVDSVSE